MLEVKETNIGGRMYTLPVMNSIRGRKVLLKVMKVIGPLANLAQAKTDDEERPADGALVGKVIQEVLDNLDETTFDWILREIVQGGMVSGEEPDTMLPLSKDSTQNLVWGAGEGYLNMFKFAAWALEINFGGFMGGLPTKLRTLKTA